MPVGTVTLSPLRPHHAGEILKHSFISISRPTVHNNPFRKHGYSTEPEEFQNAGFAFNPPSTLIRFQTKTELFCSVFKKVCVQTYRFRIVFDRPHYNAVSVLKTLLHPRWEWSTRRMRISIYRPTKLAPFLILVYFDDYALSDSIVFSVHTRKQRFQIAPLWRAFSNVSVFGNRFRRCSVAWTIAVSGVKPLRFRLKTNWCERSLSVDRKDFKTGLVENDDVTIIMWFPTYVQDWTQVLLNELFHIWQLLYILILLPIWQNCVFWWLVTNENTLLSLS